MKLVKENIHLLGLTIIVPEIPEWPGTLYQYTHLEDPICVTDGTHIPVTVPAEDIPLLNAITF